MEKVQRYLTEKEGQYFDRKSARLIPKAVVKPITAFANANGGKLAIGIEDNLELTGFDVAGAYTTADYLTAIRTLTDPVPHFSYEEFSVIDVYGNADKILVIDVKASVNAVVRTTSGSVYLRVDDKSLKQTPEQIANLERDKSQRAFEDQLLLDSSLADVDEQLLQTYKAALGAAAIANEKFLSEQGLMRAGHLTQAGMLLFGRETFIYLPHARVRLLRYAGVKNETGQRLNLIKEFDYEGAIPSVLAQITAAVKSQLRERQFLQADGRFTTMPEYPEFAWQEGIVNALMHRDYTQRGEHIRISLYDDRLEIFSPGALPKSVTLATIRHTKYARNPRIARVLSEVDWLKSTGGVDRIYEELQRASLYDP